MNQNTTPGKAAKAWAKAHPNFEGVLEVQSYTRKGRGGWKGLTTRSNIFFIRDGKSRQRRDGKDTGFNGVCEICGQVYLDTVLAWAHGPDPLAGQTVPDGELWNMYKGERAIYGDRAKARACPSCIKAHDLKVGWIAGGPTSWEKPLVWVRYHPLVKFSLYEGIDHEILDIRGEL